MLTLEQEAELQKRGLLFEQKLDESCDSILAELSSQSKELDQRIKELSGSYRKSSALFMSSDVFFEPEPSNYYRDNFLQKLSIINLVLLTDRVLLTEENAKSIIEKLSPYLPEEKVNHLLTGTLPPVYLVVFSSPAFEDLLTSLKDKKAIEEKIDQWMQDKSGEKKDPYVFYYDLLIESHPLPSDYDIWQNS